MKRTTATICSICKLPTAGCIGHIGIRKGCRQWVTVELEGTRIARIIGATDIDAAGGTTSYGLTGGVS